MARVGFFCLLNQGLYTVYWRTVYRPCGDEGLKPSNPTRQRNRKTTQWWPSRITHPTAIQPTGQAGKVRLKCNRASPVGSLVRHRRSEQKRGKNHAGLLAPALAWKPTAA